MNKWYACKGRTCGLNLFSKTQLWGSAVGIPQWTESWETWWTISLLGNQFSEIGWKKQFGGTSPVPDRAEKGVLCIAWVRKWELAWFLESKLLWQWDLGCWNIKHVCLAINYPVLTVNIEFQSSKLDGVTLKPNTLWSLGKPGGWTCFFVWAQLCFEKSDHSMHKQVCSSGNRR